MSSSVTKRKREENVVVICPIVYGSIANVITGKRVDDMATHRWTLFVRGPNGEDLSTFVSKVAFTLHVSFANPIREVTSPPFEVTEVGWGEFEAGVRIYFKGSSYDDDDDEPVTVTVGGVASSSASGSATIEGVDAIAESGASTLRPSGSSATIDSLAATTGGASSVAGSSIGAPPSVAADALLDDAGAGVRGADGADAVGPKTPAAEQELSVRPVELVHMLRLYHPTAAIAAAGGGNGSDAASAALAAKRLGPVVSEKYDEIVFKNPPLRMMRGMLDYGRNFHNPAAGAAKSGVGATAGGASAGATAAASTAGGAGTGTTAAGGPKNKRHATSGDGGGYTVTKDLYTVFPEETELLQHMTIVYKYLHQELEAAKDDLLYKDTLLTQLKYSNSNNNGANATANANSTTGGSSAGGGGGAPATSSTAAGGDAKAAPAPASTTASAPGETSGAAVEGATAAPQ